SATRWTRPPRSGRSPPTSTGARSPATSTWPPPRAPRSAPAGVAAGGGGGVPRVRRRARRGLRGWREELCGPVVVVQPFDTDEEAVALANDSAYGLNAMVFTESLRRAHRVAAAVRAGTIWVNCFFVRDLRAPCGGYKDSGIGREGGSYSREFFTEAKAVVMQLGRTAQRRGAARHSR